MQDIKNSFAKLAPSKKLTFFFGFIFSFLLAGIFFAEPVQAVSNFEKGAVVDLTWGIPSSDVDRTVIQLQDAGVKIVRMNANWVEVEPNQKGVYDNAKLAQYDYAVNKVRAAGITILMPFSDHVPYWASADPAKYTDANGKHWNKHYRPTKTGDYATFVKNMVNRYKVLGVHLFEVWNEPNTKRFWPSAPSADGEYVGVQGAKEYKALLAAAYPNIKAADPTATVVLGGLSKNDYNYLQLLYNEGAKPYFDVVAIHPYTGNVDPTWCWNQAGTTKKAIDAFCGIEEVRNTMVANGDSAKNIWLTEMGWSTSTSTYGVTEAQQADFLTKAFTKLETYPYVKKALWYNFRNNYWENNEPTSLEANLGLLKTDFSQKPAYNSFKTYNP